MRLFHSNEIQRLRITYNQILNLVFRLDAEIELLREEKEKNLEPLQEAFDLLVEKQQNAQEIAKKIDAEIFEKMGFLGLKQESTKKMLSKAL